MRKIYSMVVLFIVVFLCCDSYVLVNHGKELKDTLAEQKEYSSASDVLIDENKVALSEDCNLMQNDDNSSVVYDLLEYCDDVSKTDSFILFLSSLNEEDYKILQIPNDHILILNHYILLPSNCMLTGGKIQFVKEAIYADVFNEAYILNRHSYTYWDKMQDTNISVSNVEIEYDCALNGKSLFRFRNVSNLRIENCGIYIYNSESNNTSHNAAIDLFKGCTGVVIQNNMIDLDNINSYAGGAIWIRSMVQKNIDPEKMITSDVLVKGNTILSNCCDELIAVGTSGWHVQNIEIEANVLIRKDKSNKNLMLAVCPSSAGNIYSVKIFNNIFNINNSKLPQYNREIIRIGGEYRNKYDFIIKDVAIENNVIIGNLEGATAIKAVEEETNGARVIIKNNQICNLSEAKNSNGIKAYGKNYISQNKFLNIENEQIIDGETDTD